MLRAGIACRHGARATAR